MAKTKKGTTKKPKTKKPKTKKEKKEEKSEPSAKQKKVQNAFRRAVVKFKEYKEEHPHGEKMIKDFVKAEFK